MVQSLRVNSCQYTSTASSLSIAWHELRRRYLPVAVADRDSIWRYSRGALPDDPDQGWKLHVSATVLTATKVLSAVGPLLKGRNVLFKGPVSLVELGKLNAGIHYGYSQVGKFLTIYPKTSAEAVLLAQELYRLTRLCQGPSVPFDRKYRQDGCLYYRYGAFKSSDESERFTISDPQGNAIADDRESETTPSWEIDPFRTVKPNVSATGKSNGRPTLLQTTFKPFRALAQRGKGGVYQALDLSRDSPRLCLLKEGRRGGEIDFDGRDGVWRVRHEKRVLARLRASAVEVPEVYGSFAAEGNYYLALEFIDGANFEEFLHGRTRRLSITEALGRSMEIALLMSRIHAAGWVWRDCKPRNLILTKNGRLRPVDFEGACRIVRPDSQPWGSPSYVAPEWDADFTGQSRLPEDLFALGVMIFVLFAGRPPDSTSNRIASFRRKVPQQVEKIAARLLATNPHRRPSANRVCQILTQTLEEL